MSRLVKILSQLSYDDLFEHDAKACGSVDPAHYSVNEDHLNIVLYDADYEPSRCHEEDVDADDDGLIRFHTRYSSSITQRYPRDCEPLNLWIGPTDFVGGTRMKEVVESEAKRTVSKYYKALESLDEKDPRQSGHQKSSTELVRHVVQSLDNSMSFLLFRRCTEYELRLLISSILQDVIVAKERRDISELVDIRPWLESPRAGLEINLKSSSKTQSYFTATERQLQQAIMDGVAEKIAFSSCPIDMRAAITSLYVAKLISLPSKATQRLMDDEDTDADRVTPWPTMQPANSNFIQVSMNPIRSIHEISCDPASLKKYFPTCSS